MANTMGAPALPWIYSRHITMYDELPSLTRSMHILILNTIHIVLDYSLVKSDLIVSRVLGVFRVAMRVAIVTMFPILLVAVSTRTVMAMTNVWHIQTLSLMCCLT